MIFLWFAAAAYLVLGVLTAWGNYTPPSSVHLEPTTAGEVALTVIFWPVLWLLFVVLIVAVTYQGRA